VAALAVDDAHEDLLASGQDGEIVYNVLPGWHPRAAGNIAPLAAETSGYERHV
jgi:hypothetical protein